MIREGITEEIEEAKKGIENALKIAKNNNLPENCIFDLEESLEVFNTFKLLENCKNQILKEVKGKGFKITEKNTMQNEMYFAIFKQTENDLFIYTKGVSIWTDGDISFFSTTADIEEIEIEG